jgi:hypothetical protein
MSVSSQMSEMSISLNGEMIDLEVAVDETFKNLQECLNNTQCDLRNLASIDERNETFEVSHSYCTKIDDNISEMNELFKSLKSIVKQIKMKPETDEDKQFVKDFEFKRREEKNEQKRLAEIEKEQQKMRESKMND